MSPEQFHQLYRLQESEVVREAEHRRRAAERAEQAAPRPDRSPVDGPRRRGLLVLAHLRHRHAGAVRPA